ncbi:MAG: acetylglutamate kinase [Gemmatimonadota bacterium]
MLTVVKVGGKLVDDPESLAALARGLVALEGSVVVVHGGGPEITAWQERLGIPVEWNEGLRVTTPPGMQVTAMVLSGWMNKRLVAALLDAEGRAVGISGEDGRLMEAERKRDGALGEVGQVVAIDIRPIEVLLHGGMIPVVSPVSRGPEGAPLNVNGDEAAIALAGSLGADRLLLLSDVPGVLVDDEALESIDAERAAELVASGAVTGGMQVKVEMALEAARQGVDVRIGNRTLLDDPEGGTCIRVNGSTATLAEGPSVGGVESGEPKRGRAIAGAAARRAAREGRS